MTQLVRAGVWEGETGDKLHNEFVRMENRMKQTRIVKGKSYLEKQKTGSSWAP